MTQVSIGALRHRLDLEILQTTSDGAGGATLSWVKQDELWAKIIPMQGNENMHNDRISSSVNYDIIVRYRTDIEPEMRLRKNTRIFHIQSVTNLGERNQWLMLKCQEREL